MEQNCHYNKVDGRIILNEAVSTTTLAKKISERFKSKFSWLECKGIADTAFFI